MRYHAYTKKMDNKIDLQNVKRVRKCIWWKWSPKVAFHNVCGFINGARRVHALFCSEVALCDPTFRTYSVGWVGVGCLDLSEGWKTEMCQFHSWKRHKFCLLEVFYLQMQRLQSCSAVIHTHFWLISVCLNVSCSNPFASFKS